MDFFSIFSSHGVGLRTSPAACTGIDILHSLRNRKRRLRAKSTKSRQPPQAPSSQELQHAQTIALRMGEG